MRRRFMFPGEGRGPARPLRPGPGLRRGTEEAA
jgi:hypothetical protein